MNPRLLTRHLTNDEARAYDNAVDDGIFNLNTGSHLFIGNFTYVGTFEDVFGVHDKFSVNATNGRAFMKVRMK